MGADQLDPLSVAKAKSEGVPRGENANLRRKTANPPQFPFENQVSPTLPSWTQLISALKELESLRQAVAA